MSMEGETIEYDKSQSNDNTIENTNTITEETNNLPPKRDLLALIRTLFKKIEFVGLKTGIQAYYLPSTDAHQVIFSNFLERKN